MNGYFRNPLVSTVAFIALSVLFFWFFHTNQPVKDTTRFLGRMDRPTRHSQQLHPLCH